MILGCFQALLGRLIVWPRTVHKQRHIRHEKVHGSVSAHDSGSEPRYMRSHIPVGSFRHSDTDLYILGDTMSKRVTGADLMMRWRPSGARNKKSPPVFMVLGLTCPVLPGLPCPSHIWIHSAWTDSFVWHRCGKSSAFEPIKKCANLHIGLWD